MQGSSQLKRARRENRQSALSGHRHQIHTAPFTWVSYSAMISLSFLNLVDDMVPRVMGLSPCPSTTFGGVSAVDLRLATLQRDPPFFFLLCFLVTMHR